MSYSVFNENEVPNKNFKHVHLGDPKMFPVVSSAKYNSAVWGLWRERVGVLESK